MMRCAYRTLRPLPWGHLRYHHNFALTRELPTSFEDSISKYHDKSKDPNGGISIAKAKSQHEDYVAFLRRKVPTLTLPPLEEHPDSVFVEDTVVAVQNRAVITHPGHVSRQGEVVTIRNVLKQLGMDVWDMHTKDEGALCDGGDVLFTGRHMFVGLSDRTNEKGAAVLADAFSSSSPVFTVPFNPEDALHLKSIVTHLDETTLLAPIGAIGDALLEAMKPEDLGYTILRLPDIQACNVVAINGSILASSSSCSESKDLLHQAAKERSLTLEFVGNTEIAKSDGANTCCSVLLSL